MELLRFLLSFSSPRWRGWPVVQLAVVLYRYFNEKKSLLRSLLQLLVNGRIYFSLPLLRNLATSDENVFEGGLLVWDGLNCEHLTCNNGEKCQARYLASPDFRQILTHFMFSSSSPSSLVLPSTWTCLSRRDEGEEGKKAERMIVKGA